MKVRGGKNYRLVAVALGALFVLAGCHYAGGGIMQSAAGGSARASFSFDMNCPTGGSTQSGVLTYSDPASHVLIRATASGPVGFGYFDCYPNDYGHAKFTGTYVTLNGPSGHGTFCLTVYPPNKPGSITGASFTLSLSGGPLDGYYNSGPVLAGNIVQIGGPEG